MVSLAISASAKNKNPAFGSYFFRVSKNPQTVKMSFLYHRLISAVVGTGHCPVLMPSGIKKPCGARHFDLLHNSTVAVPVIFLAAGAAASAADRSHSLRSLYPPPAALPSLPTVPSVRRRRRVACLWRFFDLCDEGLFSFCGVDSGDEYSANRSARLFSAIEITSLNSLCHRF